MTIFEQNMVTMYKAAGQQWLDALPEMVRQHAEQWQLTDLKPFESLSYHYVLSGIQGTQPIALKLGYDHENLAAEAAALQVFSGYGAVRVLASAPGALLLERPVPGISLKTYFPERDELATNIACQMMEELHQTPTQNITKKFDCWFTIFDQPATISVHHLQRALALRETLLATSTTQVVLHGDLHHDNILAAADGTWRVIDPFWSCCGDPAFEAAAFIANPLPQLLEHPDVLHIINRRIDAFAHYFSWQRARIIQWCYLRCLMAWLWGLQDQGDAVRFEKLTEIFANLL